jgi:hypothetical protein
MAFANYKLHITRLKGGSIMKRIIIGLIIVVLVAPFMFAEVAKAEPSTGWVYVTLVRPYSNTDLKVYVEINSSAVCNTSVFAIKVNDPNGKEMYAAALAAFIAQKKVILEASNSTGCTGWGTLLQSLYIGQ